jgi:hypothetical protein
VTKKAVAFMVANADQLGISREFKTIGLLKFELLAAGLQVSSVAQQYVSTAKYPLRTRSGSSGGLDIILPFDIYVNAPTEEKFASRSPLILDYVFDNSWFAQKLT